MTDHATRVSENGMALVTVLLMVGMVAAITIAVGRMSGMENRMTQNARAGEEAYAIAQAGIQHGLFLLRRDPGRRGEVLKEALFGIGSYTVNITDSPSGGARITSNGSTQEASKTVVAELSSQQLADLCVPVSQVITVDKDTSITDEVKKQDYSYGGDKELLIGQEKEKSHRTLLSIDLSSIPSSSNILSATLDLYIFSKEAGDEQTIDLEVHRVTRWWKEGILQEGKTPDGATWITYNGSSYWNTPGGDFYPTIEAVTTIAKDDLERWYSWDVTTLVQRWVRGSISNRGLILKQANEEQQAFAGRFYSTESDQIDLAPRLNLIYCRSQRSD